jgi:pimeloyl-ACP methyl ester carboxylesterase
MTTSYSWRYVLAELGRSYRVIAPDLPGSGRSGKPAGPYRASTLAGFLGELIGALQIRGCAAVGNSLGGYLCMRLALADEGALSRLVNVHSPAFPEPRLRALHRLMAVPGAVALLAALVRRAPERWAHKHVHYFDEGLKSREEAREYGAPLATAEGALAFARTLAEVLDPRELSAFVAELEQRRQVGAGFPIPVCLIYARRDPMVPPSVGRRLSMLVPEAELHWLERSSHFAQVDSPDEVTAIARRFLGRTPEDQRA